MPEICRFNGIVIRMLFGDNRQHHLPHIHVTYAEYEASVGLDGELLSGSLPSTQLTLVKAWLILHEADVKAAWENAVNNRHFDKIAPLR